MDIYDLPIKRSLPDDSTLPVRIVSFPSTGNPFIPFRETDVSPLKDVLLPGYDVGGHYEALRALPAKFDVTMMPENETAKLFEAAMKDTQHFTPTVYGKK